MRKKYCSVTDGINVYLIFLNLYVSIMYMMVMYIITLDL